MTATVGNGSDKPQLLPNGSPSPSATEPLAAKAYERRIAKLNADKVELERKLAEALRAAREAANSTVEAPAMEVPPPGGPEDTELARRLQARVSQLETEAEELRQAAADHRRNSHADRESLMAAATAKNQAELKAVQRSAAKETATAMRELHLEMEKRRCVEAELAAVIEESAALRSSRSKLSREMCDLQDEVDELRLRTEDLRQQLKETERAKREVRLGTGGLPCDLRELPAAADSATW